MSRMFRNLKTNEIEIRVQSVTQKGAVLVPYVSSRCAMDILDETVSPMFWKREQLIKNNINHCILSIFNNDIKEWISKEDVGVASASEAVKGASSDSFKRACVNWGIGRELYSSPFLFANVKTLKDEKNNKWTLENKFQKFYVSRIEYDSLGNNITNIEIVDCKHNIVFTNYSNNSISRNFDNIKDVTPEKNKIAINKIISVANEQTINNQLSYHKIKNLSEANEAQLKMIWSYVNKSIV
ncbi:MAG: Rad52/Rad22 family DNA repair protein [Cetobacterium sp.]